MNNPIVTELNAGTYYWCSCGKTATEPFCDGSHEKTGSGPVEFKINAREEVALCNCQKSNKPPFCDGSHKK